MDANQTGALIKKARIKKNMTQKEFASKISVSPYAVSKWENGRGIPDISNLESISSVLDIPLNDLILGKQITDATGDTVTKDLIQQADKETKQKLFRRTIISVLVTCLLIAASLLAARSIMIQQLFYVRYNPKGFTYTKDQMRYTKPNITVTKENGRLYECFNGYGFTNYSLIPHGDYPGDKEDVVILILGNEWGKWSHSNSTVTKENVSGDQVKIEIGDAGWIGKVYCYCAYDENMENLLISEYTGRKSTVANTLDNYVLQKWDTLSANFLPIYDSENESENIKWQGID
jgi:transcriptional regulator with XRE-family HTH domain